MTTLIRFPAAKSGDYTIPDGVTAIGECAFYGYSDITGVTIPEGVTSIGEHAFYNCYKLTCATLPDGVTSLGDFAFYGCVELGDVVIPDGVTAIGDSVFCRCSSLTEVTIPDGVTSIGDSAFAACEGLVSLTIPDSVTAIGNSAFSGCAGLTDAAIPDGVTSIGNSAFARCGGLTSVSIPEGVTSIGDAAFVQCSGLTSVSIPNSVEVIGVQAFAFCSALTSVMIPDSVTVIEGGLFNGCGSLADVTIPVSVTKIGEYAFSDCRGLTDVYFGGTEQQWTELEIHRGNDALTTAAVHFTQEPEPIDPGPQPPVNPFTDVEEGTWYTDAVLWAVEKGVTQGTSETTFSPTAGCTRGQVVTFLWRAAGSPEPEGAENPFTDVAEAAYFHKAVLWAVENGVTNGTGEGTFSPDSVCTRGQVVTFLWRAAGSPEPEGAENPFTDVAEADYFYKAVLWAVENGVTQGTSETAFSPANTCTRAHVVTFLHRAMGE